MARGNQHQSKSAGLSLKTAQSQTVKTSGMALTQTSPLARDFFMQMQRTAGNRATQTYAIQRIQRNPQQQAVAPPSTVPAPVPVAAPIAVPAQTAPAQVAPTAVPASDSPKERADTGAGVVSAFSESFGNKSDDFKDAYDTTKDASLAQQSVSHGAVAATADLIGGPFQILRQRQIQPFLHGTLR